LKPIVAERKGPTQSVSGRWEIDRVRRTESNRGEKTQNSIHYPRPDTKKKDDRRIRSEHATYVAATRHATEQDTADTYTETRGRGRRTRPWKKNAGIGVWGSVGACASTALLWLRHRRALHVHPTRLDWGPLDTSSGQGRKGKREGTSTLVKGDGETQTTRQRRSVDQTTTRTNGTEGSEKQVSLIHRTTDWIWSRRV